MFASLARAMAASKSKSKRPTKIAIDHDDYHAEFVGQASGGRQFFLTTPFVGASGRKPGREFIALYVFDRAGKLLQATIDDLGTRKKLDHAARIARRDALIASLGKVRYRRISIAPFSVKRFGLVFGLVAQAPETADDEWRVTLEPGDFMCFWAPWNSGIYDT